MKRHFLLMLWICSSVLVRSQPIPATTNLAVVDINGDREGEVVYEAFVANQTMPWRVFLSLYSSNPSEFLATSEGSPFLDLDASLDNTRPHYRNLDIPNQVVLSGYGALRDPKTLIWTFYNLGDPLGASDRLEVFLGLRFLVGDDTHFGWLHLTRPNLKPETIFEVAGSDWNPIANAPIRVGRPPEIPITTEPSPDGGSLRLSWPGGVAHWVFESTPNLVPPVVWTEYPAGGTYADVALDEARRYFRLRRPE